MCSGFKEAAKKVFSLVHRAYIYDDLGTKLKTSAKKALQKILSSE